MNRTILGLVVFLISSPLFAQASLMFSKKEQGSILLKRAQIHQKKLRNKEDCLDCDGIIFQGEHNWSAWINGQKFDPSCRHCPRQHITISAITKNHIQLQWKHKGTTHIVTLSPNQHYNANLKKVVTLNEAF